MIPGDSDIRRRMRSPAPTPPAESRRPPGMAVALLVGLVAYALGTAFLVLYDYERHERSERERTASRHRIDRIEAWAAARGYVAPTAEEIKRLGDDR